MESEHSMAREDSDGSETATVFMAIVSCFFEESNLRIRGSEKRESSNLAEARVS
jgi:hypothetical protein